MSIMDVYRAVTEIGRTDPGTLMELSFISHGYGPGPILVNSYDDRVYHIPWPSPRGIDLPIDEGWRDPDDKDGRTYDFSHTTILQTSEFKAAFHPDGIVWLWGCNSNSANHWLLTQIEKNPVYRPSGVRGEEVFQFYKLSAKTVVSMEYLLDFHLSDGFSLPRPLRWPVKFPFKHLKFLFCLVHSGTYAQAIADASGVVTYAAASGTGANLEKGTLPIMRVEDFPAHFNFYENYLGFEFDPEGRQYMQYPPGRSCSEPAAVHPRGAEPRL